MSPQPEDEQSQPRISAYVIGTVGAVVFVPVAPLAQTISAASLAVLQRVKTR